MTETPAAYLVNSVSEGLVHRILEDLLSVLIRFVVHKSLVLINNILHWDSIAHLSIVRTGETYKQINSLSKLRQHIYAIEPQATTYFLHASMIEGNNNRSNFTVSDQLADTPLQRS